MNKKSIELTKSEMKSAMVFGTQEYKNLQEARRDYPGYKVVELKAKRNKNDFSGVDMGYIRSYVEKNGSPEQKEALAFLSQKSVDAEGNYHEPQPFFQIKAWFLNEFPELKQQRVDYRKKVLEIYRAAEEKAQAAAQVIEIVA